MVISQEERGVALRAALLAAFDHYYGEVPSEHQERFLNTVNRTIRGLTCLMKSDFAIGCPANWDECRDGCCAPPGEC